MHSKVLVRKPEGQRLLEISRHKWEDNIRKVPGEIRQEN
jgi:hypothetical protein